MKKNIILFIVILIIFLVVVVIINKNFTNKKLLDDDDVINYGTTNTTTIDNINDFYNTEITKNKSIYKLSRDYSLKDSIEDGCFVVSNAKVYNDNLYEEFMNNFESKQTCFIRIVKNTTEGDIIISDVMYYKDTNKLYLVYDNTRDGFIEDSDKGITMSSYNNIGTYKYKNNEYLVLYNDIINDTNFETDNVFSLAIIN